MNLSVRNKLLLIASLAMLSLRALTPDGYMPGSQGSGLLYELCPSGMPVEIMQALAGDEHHGHHGHGDTSADSVSATEQCPIGHMLASAVAVDSAAPPEFIPEATWFNIVPSTVVHASSTTAYRSRAPPV